VPNLKIAIICPHFTISGGVRNYYITLKKYLSCDYDIVEIGAVKEHEMPILKLRNLIRDIRKILNLFKKKSDIIDIVHINPSFLYGSLIRDAIFLILAKKFNLKTIVFFRGINKKTTEIIEKYFFSIFYNIYNKTDVFIVLNNEFKSYLRKMKFEQPIYLETTLVDDNLLKEFSIRKKVNELGDKKSITFLFISRIVREKGIIETIKTFDLLSKKYLNVTLNIAGNGPYLNRAKLFAQNCVCNKRIRFHGHVDGIKKIDLLKNSDIFLFPTDYGEGMPNSIIEAMAFGMPIITRPVGGIKDIFNNGKNGFMTESKDPKQFYKLTERIINDIKLWEEISLFNYNLAKDKFYASTVGKRLENIYAKTILS